MRIDAGRRRWLGRFVGVCAATGIAPATAGDDANPHRRWYERALAMRRLAEANGDQPYGAALVLAGRLIGEAPSRVVQLGNPAAHAEREAIRAAREQLGRSDLTGAVLYSTSRPCAACEAAAAHAGVVRMIHGERLVDAGAPRER